MMQETGLQADRPDAGRVVARALHEPVLVPLPELGVIAVSGADAVAFLQTQLTNDVARLGESDLQLNGYCTAKGRLLATFHQWRDGDEILLRLPRELLPSVLKRLSMFVLRAKAKLTDASERWSTSALLGPQLAEHARDAGVELPAAAWTGRRLDAGRIDRVPGVEPLADRLLLTLPATAEVPQWCRSWPRVASDAWWWSEVNAALPTVFAATQEKFVPQMINFEVIGGVDFKKGCYPGQEVVARSQYLGKLKRRMSLAHAAAATPPLAADVYLEGAPQPIGTVVMAAPAPAGGTDLLFEAPSDRLADGTLRLGAPDGAALSVRALPYALFDPTA